MLPINNLQNINKDKTISSTQFVVDAPWVIFNSMNTSQFMSHCPLGTPNFIIIHFAVFCSNKTFLYIVTLQCVYLHFLVLVSNIGKTMFIEAT